jgi:hypothetical protein
VGRFFVGRDEADAGEAGVEKMGQFEMPEGTDAAVIRGAAGGCFIEDLLKPVVAAHIAILLTAKSGDLCAMDEFIARFGGVSIGRRDAGNPVRSFIFLYRGEKGSFLNFCVGSGVGQAGQWAGRRKQGISVGFVW